MRSDTGYKRVSPISSQSFLAPLLDDIRTRVEFLIDAVPEPHDLRLCVSAYPSIPTQPDRGRESIDQVHGRLVCTTMQWASQRADTGRDGRMQIGQR